MKISEPSIYRGSTENMSEVELKKIDLHLHTTASDGRLSPAELVRLSAERGLSIIAITDHDSTEGVDEALETAANMPDMMVVPGVEISTDVPGGEVHIVGLFIDYQSPKLQKTLARMRNGRELRAKKMVERLAKLDIHIKWDRVSELAGEGSVGRPHVAQAMLEQGYISTIEDAFEKYIGRSGPAYAEREKLTPREAVELVTGVDGLAVLAHPGSIGDLSLEELLEDLKQAGLVGIEVYYADYPPEKMKALDIVANAHGLVSSGGSDYHGFAGEAGVELGAVPVPYKAAEELMTIHQERMAKKLADHA
jgi:hypothetical protein